MTSRSVSLDQTDAHERPSQLVVLAAGMGSRIRAGGVDLPKPLVSVGGLPLLKRTILTAQKAGVSRFVVILGFEAELIFQTLSQDSQLSSLDIEWVRHDRYDLKNGVSVLQAQPHIQGEFYLTMADHVVEPALYEALAAQPLQGDLALAVDYKLDQVFDMDDATKVQVGHRNEIVEIDKSLTQFDAVDTGLFRCNEGLFDALQSFYDREGDASLSQGVKALAERDRAYVVDIGQAWWQDVDDVATRNEAERRLFAALTKAADGFVSRNFNRPVSKLISRQLMNTSVSPNTVTSCALIIGLLGACANMMIDAQNLWLLAVGGVLFHFSSVVDGVDGELARLKFQFSPFGAWFDTISDVIINVSYLFSLGFAVSQVTGNPLWVTLSSASLIMILHIIQSMSKSLRARGETFLPAMEWSFNDDNDLKSIFQKLCKYGSFAARRDFYAFVLMILSFMGIAVAKVSVLLTILIVSFAFVQNLRTQFKMRAQSMAAPQPQHIQIARSQTQSTQLTALKEQTA